MEKKPNVLLISTDHWPASLLGEAGHSTVLTPTLDQMARNGVRFTNAYAECPVCIPARRTLMTGTTPRKHGDRVFKERLPMPEFPTLAQTFRDNGYQAYAVGKLHVYPQRDRIGFDDVQLVEEGRVQFGALDDYELFLGDQGHVGEQFAGGMNNNEYVSRPWHLAEELHVTNWTTQQMARTIQRRDPTRPAFWFLSYSHPHPPLAPLQAYLDLYRDVEVPQPFVGEWTKEFERLPYPFKAAYESSCELQGRMGDLARRAFYALCTHIDHQLRVVLGTLRAEGELDNTIIMFTSDHGDMLGDHNFWAKRVFLENSANIPMLLMGVAGDERVGHHRVDDRIVGWQDVMPTLLDLAGLEIPESVEGISMVGEKQRDYLYGEVGEDFTAMRMIRQGDFKLIYYPTGNYLQLFNLQDDPHEMNDLSQSEAHAGIREELTQRLIGELYGGDEECVRDGKLCGTPEPPFTAMPNRGLSGQRGSHWPPPLGSSKK
jgi:arylsulfatase A-like enzyme